MGPKTTADTFTVFGGSQKNGRYVYGFQRGSKKQPIHLRSLVGPQKTADTFTVFGTSPTPTQQHFRNFEGQGSSAGIFVHPIGADNIQGRQDGSLYSSEVDGPGEVGEQSWNLARPTSLQHEHEALG